MSDVFRTLIVAANLAPLARALAAGLSPRGAGMFVAPLSADGAAPASHYVSTGFIDPTVAELLEDSGALHSACAAAGANVSLAQCEALVASSDVSEDPPAAAFARLGLALIADPES